MSRSSAGARVEKLAEEKLKGYGYRVEKVRRTKWQRQDFFGCWDLMGVKNGKVIFVQVSKNPIYKRGVQYKKKLAEFPHPRKEYWWYKGRGIWDMKSL